MTHRYHYIFSQSIRRTWSFCFQAHSAPVQNGDRRGSLQPLHETRASCLVHERHSKTLDKRDERRARRCQLPIHAIQSVYMNTSTMMWCQWVIQSELKNNEMPHYHNFPDLDEWFSNSGLHCPLKYLLSLTDSLACSFTLCVCASVMKGKERGEILRKVKIFSAIVTFLTVYKLRQLYRSIMTKQANPHSKCCLWASVNTSLRFL